MFAHPLNNMPTLTEKTNAVQSELPIHILVVEDNIDQWRFIDVAFKQQTMPILPVLATNEQQALSLLEPCTRTGSTCPRLILLDLYLPRRENSLQFLQALRSKPAPVGAIPVVMLTASDHYDDISASFQGGINAYMVKPNTFSDWLDCIRELKTYWLMR
jgi:CheY-like chemotaxis protein